MGVCSPGACEFCGCHFRKPSDVMRHRCAAMQEAERDRLAENWLLARHTPEWYIGDASAEEWTAAYAVADKIPSPRRES